MVPGTNLKMVPGTISGETVPGTIIGMRRFAAGLAVGALVLGGGACERAAPRGDASLPAPLALAPVVRTRLAELRARAGEAAAAPVPSEATRSRLEDLVPRLREPDPALRRRHEDAIVALGPEAIPALAAALADTALPDPSRGAAALALSRLDHDAALPPLLVALRDRSRYVRAFAATACGALGRDEAVPELLFRFKEEYEPEGVVVNAAARALLRFGNVGGLDRLVKNLRGRQLEREGAIELLAEITGSDRGFDAYSAEIERRAAAAAWEEWLAFEGAAFLESRPAPPPPSDRLALRILETVDRLREYQMRTIDDARLVLERLGRTAVPFLRLGLADEDAKIRGYAIEVLTLLGPRALDAAPELAALTRDGVLAPFAFQALGAVGAKGAALPLIESGLRDARPDVRIACAGALGALGDAERGLGPLRDLLREKNLPADVEFAAAVAAGSLGDLASFRRAIELAEEGGAIDPDLAVRAVEDALARATRRRGGSAPFRSAGALEAADPLSGSSHQRRAPADAAAPPPADGLAAPASRGALSGATGPDLATRIAAVRSYLDANAP